MKINNWMLGLLVLVTIFGGIGISSATGAWQTTSTKIPATYTSGEFAGQYNPADIRGSYTFGEISELFKVPLNDLAVAFGMEEQKFIAEVECKELEALYIDAATGNSVGTNSVRIFVALYKGLPITLSDTDYLLTAAVQILKEKAILTAEQTMFLDGHILVPMAIVVSPTTTHKTTAGTITGKTTFQDLLNWGLQPESIESVIKEKLPAKTLGVRDYASQKGIEFTTLKSQLQALLDALDQ